MEQKKIRAALGRTPFDLVVKDVQLVNVMTEEIYPADIGIVGDEFAFAGTLEPCHSATQTVDGRGMFAVPGFIDSHMHIESSMMTPINFARAVLPRGTTTVAADPHEMGNVLGTRGVELMAEWSRGLPLQVHVMAPSTIPSAPGYETSGCEIGGQEVAEMLTYPGVHGLGEVMDSLGVVACDKKMLGIVAAAKQAGVLMDGHAPTLRGKELQAFVSTGIDCDHTYMDADLVEEKLRNGMCVQIQERFFTQELMAYLNRLPVQNRVMLATDDVPISRLWNQGHVDGLVRRAIALGLSPQKAIRYVTINPADRLRLYRTGAICPGRRADFLLLSSLEDVVVRQVYSGGTLVAQDGKILVTMDDPPMPKEVFRTLRLEPLTPDDFVIPCTGTGSVPVNAIRQDGITSRTTRVTVNCRVQDGVLQPGRLVKMAVFERHTGNGGRCIGLMDNLDGFRGALATTYAHDCHNLSVYSANDTDAAKAANLVLKMGGGVVAILDGEVLCAIALPIGGILCQDPVEVLAAKFQELDRAAARMGLNHQEPLTFLATMPLAVSPQIKLTDRGIVDVTNKRFVPLFEEEGERE